MSTLQVANIVFESTANNRIQYITGANTIAIATGGSERMRVVGNGNIGIGITNPTVQLHISDGNANGYAAMYFGNNAATVGWHITKDYDNTFNFWQGAFGSGTRRAQFDSNGNFLITTASLGYGAGAGGTVTQSTSKSTGVTLNKSCGQITMNAAALGAGANVSFVVTNSTVSGSGLDTILLTSPFISVNPASYRIEPLYVAAGSFAIRVTNLTGGSLSEALVINFAVIKTVLS